MQLQGAGINVVTLSDERLYRAGSNDMLDFVSSIVIMSRAHEESETKSKRIKAAWANKRRMAPSKKLTSMCPAWLKLSKATNEFQIIEAHADVVRKIYKDSCKGLGVYRIAATLNRKKFQLSEILYGWYPSYVAKILANRAVVGSFRLTAPTTANEFPMARQYQTIIRELFPTTYSTERAKPMINE